MVYYASLLCLQACFDRCLAFVVMVAYVWLGAFLVVCLGVSVVVSVFNVVLVWWVFANTAFCGL